MSWYPLSNIASIDSPALVVYKERAQQNIAHAISMVGDTSRLRPHVKTNKMAEVCRMMMDAGIYKFKCATIAEAEMLAKICAKDVLLAYQPVGPKTDRFIALIKKYSNTSFACLADNNSHANNLNNAAAAAAVTLNLFIDLNTGMNRTGIHSSKAYDLFTHCLSLNKIKVVGLQGYDGHIRDTNLPDRQLQADAAFGAVEKLIERISENYPATKLTVVAGGSPTFPVHASRTNIECSPGTFVFWDWGYKTKFPDQPFDFAALVISRVISIIDEHRICTDLGHKSVASEMPFPRVHFLNAPDAIAESQSEEHLVLQVKDSAAFKLGDVLYGVPVHICPTVALYEKAHVVENNEVTGTWKVVARDRSIGV